MVDSKEARLVPQPPKEGEEPTVGVFQGTQPGVIAYRKDVEFFENFDLAWQGCQDKVAEEADAGG
jgi:hypothetical protein